MCDKKRTRCDSENCVKCFNKSFASHPKSAYWSDKNIVKPRDVPLKTNKKFIFNCGVCRHEFKSSPKYACNDVWCPYCNIGKLCDDIECIFCFNKSFAGHPRSGQWSEKNNVNPRFVTTKNSNKYWFNCDICSHEFITVISDLTRTDKIYACPYCKNKKLCNDNNCESCFNKSFASCDKVDKWSEKNQTTPRMVFKFTHDKYIFKCKCNHEFNVGVSDMSRVDFDYQCPFCSCPPKQLCENENCINCFNNSFASYERSKNWHVKNKISPRQAFRGSSNKHWFKCDNFHEFETTLTSITSNNTWCPFCTNKTEGKLFNTLIENGYDVVSQFKADWCRNPETNVCLPFDFLIEEYKTIIEVDGIQHFQQVSNWRSPEEQHQKDLYKMECANKNGYTMIRVFQKDIWNDKNNWFEKLDLSIGIYNPPRRIYISSGNEYECFH